MNAESQDRVPYSYDEIFPERFLHAPDLDGKTVTLVITDIWGEYVQNPKQKRKKERGDLCGILSFRGTKREYAMSKQNAWIIKTLWGKDPANIIGKRITLSPVPDSSGFTEHGTRILFVGSPDIEHDLALTLPGGQALTFRKTPAKAGTIAEGSAVDPETGEVIEEPATAPLEAESSADGLLASGDAPEAFSLDVDDDPEPPGRGPANVTPLNPDAAATPQQLAEIRRLRKAAGINAAEFNSLVSEYGGEPAVEGYGLSIQQAQFVIEALTERGA